MINYTKIYISTTLMKDNTKLSDVINQFNDKGICNIELGSNHCYEESYDYLSDFSFNYLIHNYFPIPKDSFVLNIASFDTIIRQRSINHIFDAIDLCKLIDSKLYTFHPGFQTDPKGANISQNNYDFQWCEKKLNNSNYDKALSLMYNAIDKVVKYAKNRNIQVAIETEGSVSKKDHLLMQKPEEYESFIKKYSSSDIGINLNIGHLNLASKAFNFIKQDFIDLIDDFIIAMELSHNDGEEDQHLPLQPDGWYWDLIFDSRFEDVYKILEYRNTTIKQIIDNIKLIEKKADAFSVH